MTSLPPHSCSAWRHDWWVRMTSSASSTIINKALSVELICFVGHCCITPMEHVCLPSPDIHHRAVKDANSPRAVAVLPTGDTAIIGPLSAASAALRLLGLVLHHLPLIQGVVESVVHRLQQQEHGSDHTTVDPHNYHGWWQSLGSEKRHQTSGDTFIRIIGEMDFIFIMLLSNLCASCDILS